MARTEVERWSHRVCEPSCDLWTGGEERRGPRTVPSRAARRGRDERRTDGVQQLPQQLRKTLTWDLGKALSGHAQFALSTGTTVFFADP